MPKATVKPALSLAPPAEPVAEKKLVHVIQHGYARGSIYRNESKGNLSHTVNFDRHMQHGNRKEHVGQTFEKLDLRHLAEAAVECLNWIQWQEKMYADGGPPCS
jgi:hypothetical protein